VAWEQYLESKPLFSGHEESKQRLELLKKELLGKAGAELAVAGKFTPEMASCEKRINALGKDVRERVIENLADMKRGLMGDAWCILVDAAVGDDAKVRQTALRKLIISVPTMKINNMLDNIELTMRMRELARKNQWKELAASSKNVDFSKWPKSLALGAFRMRAAANFHLKNGNESKEDLEKAISLTPSRENNASDYYNLACNYEKNLKDDKKALDAYRTAAKISGEKKEQGCYENPVKD
jgi:tetratricopeptide (TPR) repeat protein